MVSLANIPEPTTAHPQVTEEPAAHAPLHAVAGVETPGRSPQPADAGSPDTRDEPQQQIDHLALLMVLFIAGALLRAVLGLLGPLQGIDDVAASMSVERGVAALAGEPIDAYPLIDLIVAGLTKVDAPAWLAVALGSVLTLAAIPAAYVLGRALTGRPLAGLFAAAVLAVHPAVLAASNTLSGSAIALGLVTIGLALVCVAAQRGTRAACVGGLLLGLAGLAAPLCGFVGALASPLVIKQTIHRGVGQAIGCGVVVLILATGPMLGLRAAAFGTGFAGVLPEFAPKRGVEQPLPPIERLLVTMAQPSFAQLGEAMHLPLRDAGRLNLFRSGTLSTEPSDPVADALADGWMLLNGAAAALAAVSFGIMLFRRRILEAALLGVPLIALAFATLPPGEALRLPLLALVAVLAMGLFSTRPVSRITDAQREAKRLAKLAKQEAKEQARQARALRKHKADLHAFDRPDRRGQPRRVVEPDTAPIPDAIAHEPDATAEPVHVGRPI
ncbi:MAG: hypothetical protein ACPGYV_06330 [Phycisphaeraceae bacterium]